VTTLVPVRHGFERTGAAAGERLASEVVQSWSTACAERVQERVAAIRTEIVNMIVDADGAG
jgi:hypothetical protein